ncbi:MAG: KamA family radical SAM protein [Chloroflexi bacterium]|nr:MAG: KamA family radical SAM protein [Chloroflexota bacterium]MBL1195417.1 KamA family radical SAM protein [Chloroflexota bacterium]NOH12700.1 KamA family radical SAM protein [Chloroflexota bacterium]
MTTKIDTALNEEHRLVTPPTPWEDVPMEKWNDWRWQLSHRLNTVEDFSPILNLTEDEIAGLSAPGAFRVDVTPYYASLMDPDDPQCPIRRQVMPLGQELVSFDAQMVDSLAEDQHSPVPGLVHRYPDRVLMMTTTQCASYCRFCTRSRIVGDPAENFGSHDYERQIAYIEANPQIRDVLLSGGDPLILPAKILDNLLTRLNDISHVEIVRLNTKVPMFLPQRITDELVDMLRRHQPLWIHLNINHAKEMAPDVVQAVAKLADAGFPLGSQSVLMAGINDCPNIILDMVHTLVRNRVRPYYLYQCDLVQGAGHFRTPVAKGIEIMEALRGHTSGYAIPTYVIDAPGGGGKVPILPNYLMSMSEDKVVVRNYEGFISTYTQADEYESHDPETCEACQARQRENKQQGVAGLLAGKKRTIEPRSWQQTHERSQD